MAEASRLPIDVVSYPVAQSLDRNALDGLAGKTKQFGASRTGGIKLVVDGSIQGYTAYLSQPYFAGTPSAAEESACESDLADRIFVGGEVPPAPSAHPAPSGGNRGYASMAQDDLNAWVKAADEAGVQLLVHCNGDAAVDMLLEAIRASRGDKPRPDLRTVIIHAQTMRDDQLDQAAAQGLITSFFPIHVVFWGDRHRDLFLGPERAARINPARSALDRGITVTLHHDAPIAQVGMLPVVAAAVNRITTSGKLLGPEQRITAFEALRAITRDAAYQYFEESRKGTLEAGKLADMVILDADPLAIDPLQIGNITVLETIKAGKTVFKR
jgi:predicted amidohydrolase YtcJ